MTTIDITTGSVFATRVPATRLRLTVRGRRVVAALVSLPVVIALSIAVVSGGGAIASGQTGAPAGTFAEITVMPGESLWSIAQAIAPNADPREVVDAIMRLNALPSGAVDAGETLSLPLVYSPQK